MFILKTDFDKIFFESFPVINRYLENLLTFDYIFLVLFVFTEYVIGRNLYIHIIYLKNLFILSFFS